MPCFTNKEEGEYLPFSFFPGQGWSQWTTKKSTLRYYLMNHPEKFVQGYSVMTTQYRYTEYVGLTE